MRDFFVFYGAHGREGANSVFTLQSSGEMLDEAF
jgi:hypothetical protein